MQVMRFYLQLETEAKETQPFPAGGVLKLGNKAVTPNLLQSGLVIEIVPPHDLKAPASIGEIKVWCYQVEIALQPDHSCHIEGPARSSSCSSIVKEGRCAMCDRNASCTLSIPVMPANSSATVMQV